MMNTRKVLIVTLEPISSRMAGPAIRACEIAKQLAGEFQISVFTPYPPDLPNTQGFELIAGGGKKALYEKAKQCDILFIQANVLKPYPHLAKLNKYLVLDLYDPYLLAVLAQYQEGSKLASASYRLMHKVLEKHMLAADFSVCASERQRDYWLGRYCSLGRMTPEIYAFDKSFRKLIDVVPFGLPEQKPKRTGPGIKCVVEGIGKDDFLLLWGGGIWEWFDPLTIIAAVNEVAKTRPSVKLYFMGIKSPNPQVELMDMTVKAIDLATKLEIKDKHVFFGDSWVSYKDRVNYLLDADVAVSAHFDLPETRFSFRTRILDYLWAALPIVTTGGDNLADLVASHEAGFALPFQNVEAWTKAIIQLIDDQNLRQKLAQGSAALSEDFHWDKAVQPLKEFCRNPHHLPAYKKVTMPNLAERAQSVYMRGGKDLVAKKSQQLVKDIFGLS
jgi:glycosyltransferase involved in cell wall biosynthesis